MRQILSFRIPSAKKSFFAVIKSSKKWVDELSKEITLAEEGGRKIDVVSKDTQIVGLDHFVGTKTAESNDSLSLHRHI